MVTSISLALGLILGEAIVEIISGIFQAAVVVKKTRFYREKTEKIWRSSCRMNFESLFSGILEHEGTKP